MVALDGGGGPGTAGFHHVRIDGPLDQEVHMTDLFGFFFEDPDEFFPDDLPFLFRVADALEFAEETILGIDPDQVHIEIPFEDLFHLVSFVFPQQAVVHEHTGKLLAHCLVDQDGSHGGIHPAAHGAEHILVPYFFPDFPDLVLGEGRHGPIPGQVADIEQEIHEIKESLVTIGASGEKLFQHKYRKPILYAFLIATFNQLSGINAILYYAPRIFEMSGVFTDSAMMQSIVIGLTNLTFTMIGMILIDQVGRRKLLYIGSIGMTLSLALVAKGFYQDALLYAYLPDGVYRFLCHFTGCRHLGINLRSLPKQCALQRASIRQHDTLGVVRPPFMDVSRFHPYRRYLHFQFLCHYDVPKLLLCSQATRNKEQVSGADTKGIDQLTTYE